VNCRNLYLQDGRPTGHLPQRLLIVGEVLWDVFGDEMHLGGAPLNFAVHVARLGHCPSLISAVGDDDLGRSAKRRISTLGLDTTFIETAARFPTGTARVEGSAEHPRFKIERPAAYDALCLTPEAVARLRECAPNWLYYGTLFACEASGKATLGQLIEAFPGVPRFYDINLRPGFDSAALVRELIALANVVKLNETEVLAVADFTGLPKACEAFCRAGRERYGWQAVCVTLGARGCALLIGEEYSEAGRHPVEVVDTVGAGDAFAAAFLHGLSQGWAPSFIATFANRVGALVASRPGAIPDWSMEEVGVPTPNTV
jgi:fructokinase